MAGQQRPASVIDIWHVTDGGGDMCYISVDRYLFKRQTDKFWFVYQRGVERRFSKSDPWVFTDYTDMKNRLAKFKQKKLGEAKREVERLSNPTPMGIHIIPSCHVELKEETEI